MPENRGQDAARRFGDAAATSMLAAESAEAADFAPNEAVEPLDAMAGGARGLPLGLGRLYG